MSSGWVGPGANSSPQNQQQLEMYKTLKAEVDKEEQEKKDARNAERAAQGLPPGQQRLAGNSICRLVANNAFTEKDSFWVRVRSLWKKAMH